MSPVSEARTAVVLARVRRDARVVSATLALAAACFVVFAVSLSLGEVDLPLLDVVASLFGSGPDGTDYIVTQLRLPRTLVAVLAGAAFGMSGVIFQTIARNPLASPDIIGITAGSAAAAVTALLGFGVTGFAMSAFALGGALAAAALMYVLAWNRGVTGYRLALVGIALAAMLTSIVSYALTRANVYDARSAMVWLVGSVNAKTWATAGLLGAFLAVLVPLALLAGRWLTGLQFGDDTARTLGLRVERSRLGLIAVAAALAAVAVAAVGQVVFVAFVAGPIARKLVGANGTALVPAALVGALVMTTSDVVAQHAFGSIQFPVGIVTAIVGAPYLLWMLTVAGRGK